MNTYPKEWPSIARYVKGCAHWRCVRCGHPDDPFKCKALDVRRGWLPCDEECGRLHVDFQARGGQAKQRILTVHHFDGDKANNHWWNLGALCQVCHLQVQGKVKMSQTWPLPHTPWFQPYVAGYYAFVVLGEELSPEQVDERMTELLIAGQPHLTNPYEDEELRQAWRPILRHTPPQ